MPDIINYWFSFSSPSLFPDEMYPSGAKPIRITLFFVSLVPAELLLPFCCILQRSIGQLITLAVGWSHRGLNDLDWLGFTSPTAPAQPLPYCTYRLQILDAVTFIIGNWEFMPLNGFFFDWLNLQGYFRLAAVFQISRNLWQIERTDWVMCGGTF